MTIIDKMKKSTGKFSEKLHRYITFRSSHADLCIAILEGNEDCIVYRYFFSQLKADSIEFFVIGGKDYLLQLRDHLQKNHLESSKRNLYFIDKDFDGFKGHAVLPNTYMTSCYSIENFLVSREVLKKLLKGEFGCNDHEARQDIDNILGIYDKRILEFYENTREINKLVYIARRSNISLNIADDAYRKHLKVSLDRVNFDNGLIQKVIPNRDNIVSITNQEQLINEFEKLDAHNDWRGKFLLVFFMKFINCLKEDRGSQKPNFFQSKKSNIHIPTDEGLMVNLSSLIDVPQCFRIFIKNNRDIIDSNSC